MLTSLIPQYTCRWVFVRRAGLAAFCVACLALVGCGDPGSVRSRSYTIASDQPERPILIIRSSRTDPVDVRYPSGLVAAMWSDGTVVRLESQDGSGEQVYASGRASEEAMDALLDSVKEAYPAAEAAENWLANGAHFTIFVIRFDQGTRRLSSQLLPLPAKEDAGDAAASQELRTRMGKPNEVSRFIDSVTRKLLAIELSDRAEFNKVDWERHDGVWPVKPHRQSASARLRPQATDS